MVMTRKWLALALTGDWDQSSLNVKFIKMGFGAWYQVLDGLDHPVGFHCRSAFSLLLSSGGKTEFIQAMVFRPSTLLAGT